MPTQEPHPRAEQARHAREPQQRQQPRPEELVSLVLRPRRVQHAQPMPEVVRLRREDRRQRVHRRLAEPPAGRRRPIPQARRRRCRQGEPAQHRQARSRPAPVPAQRQRRRHRQQHRRHHRREIRVDQEARKLEHGRQPAPPRRPAHAPPVRPQRQQQHEVRRQGAVRVAEQEARHGDREQRHRHRRHQPPLAGAAQREHRRHWLGEVAERQPELHRREPRRQPPAHQLERQRHQRVGVGHGHAQPARRVQHRRAQQRPVPGVLQERPLPDHVLRHVAAQPRVRHRAEPQQVVREHRQHEHDAHRERPAVAEPAAVRIRSCQSRKSHPIPGRQGSKAGLCPDPPKARGLWKPIR